MQSFGHFFGDSCILLGLDGLFGQTENLKGFCGVTLQINVQGAGGPQQALEFSTRHSKVIGQFLGCHPTVLSHIVSDTHWRSEKTIR